MQESPTYNVSIHLGASSLSMLVTECHEEREIEIEYLEQAVPIARDIFRHGKIKRDTLERTVDILEGYASTMIEYGLTADDIKVAAVTNIIREARNQHVVINRLQIATGIPFLILDNGGMTRLIYQKVQRRQSESKDTNTGNTLAIHVGPGNTRVLLLVDGQIARYSTYRLGSHRTSESLRETYADGAEYLQVIRGHCEAQINAIKYDYRHEEVDQMILIGYEIQLIARLITADAEFSESIKKYDDFIKITSELNEEERMSRFNLDVHAEDGFLPALQMNYNLLHAFKIKQYYIPVSNYERGLLKDLHMAQSSGREFEEESLHSARLIAHKFQADPKHYEQVLILAESLFKQTQDIHRLDEKGLHLLQMATILHEVGGYISPRMHHKHSYYLIINSDVFGLNENTLKIIALTARYHRQSGPKASHKDYTSLSSADQILVGKLSALLRVADALDVAQQQRISSLRVVRKKDRLTLSTLDTYDLELEKLALQKKGGLFEELFGLELRLETVSQQTL